MSKKLDAWNAVVAMKWLGDQAAIDTIQDTVREARGTALLEEALVPWTTVPVEMAPAIRLVGEMTPTPVVPPARVWTAELRPGVVAPLGGERRAHRVVQVIQVVLLVAPVFAAGLGGNEGLALALSQLVCGLGALELLKMV